MARSSRVEVIDGTVVVVSSAEGTEVAALRAEADRLTAASHPGVVAVVSSDGDDERWELRLAHGGRPVSLLHPVIPEQVAEIAGSVASTLADLHDRGIVHGRLTTRHVLVGPGGVVRICGFGCPPVEATPEDDVAAIGAIITDLLGTREDIEPLPETRWRRGPTWSGVARRALLSLADAASVEPAGRRPTARRLAASIAEAVPTEASARRRWKGRSSQGRAFGEGLWSAAGPGPGSRLASEASRATLAADPAHDLVHEVSPQPVPGSHARAHPVAARERMGRPRPPRSLVEDGADDRTPATDRRGPHHERPTGRPGGLRAAVAAMAGLSLLAVGAWRSLDSDEATEPLASPGAYEPPCVVIDPDLPECVPALVDGTTVVVGEATFEVGEPGDQLVVGDWDCDGSASAAVRRPSTGEVFLFPGWATQGSIEVEPHVVVPGAVDLQRPAGSCGPPEVIRADGTVEPVRLEGAS